MLVEGLAQAGGPVLLADMLVVGHTREEVVAPGRDVGVRRPLLPLQRHVALFLAVLEIVEQH